jgi:glutamyl-Q tRNA(Asp) synthetase
VNNATAGDNLWQASHYLGLSPPPALRRAEPSELLAWARAHWRIDEVPRQLAVTAPPDGLAIAKPPNA